MMFFTMGDNSIYTRGFAWIHAFIFDREDSLMDRSCSVCNQEWSEYKKNYFDRSLDAYLQSGSKWPDMLGSGSSGPGEDIVSQRALEIWDAEGFGQFPSFPIRIVPPFPKTMTTEPPMYYRLDNKKMMGMEVDWESSGYCDIKRCEACGKISWDWDKQSALARKQIVPYVLKEDTWNGKDIFCANDMPRLFCTEKVVDCAFKHKLTNFRFVPIEIGYGVGFGSVDYSTKNWRKKMEKQVEKYRNDFQPW